MIFILGRAIASLYDMQSIFSGDFGSSSIDVNAINKARRKIHRAKGYKSYGKHLRSQKKRKTRVH